MHALSLVCHWSVTLSTTVCFSSAHTEMRCCFRSRISLSHGSVETLFRWNEKRTTDVANLFTIPHTKFYWNRSDFVEDTTKTFWLTYFLHHSVVRRHGTAAIRGINSCVSPSAVRPSPLSSHLQPFRYLARAASNVSNVPIRYNGLNSLTPPARCKDSDGNKTKSAA